MPGLSSMKILPHIPIATLAPEIAARTITLLAPSKTYNIPGLGCSFAVISDPLLRKAFVRAAGRIVPHVNIFGYTAAEAAYRHGEPWRRQLLAYLRGNRDLLQQEINALPGLSMTHVEATYLAWIDVREPASTSRDAFSKSMASACPMAQTSVLSGFVRLNFGCSRSLLVERCATDTQRLGGTGRSVGNLPK